MSKNKEEDSLFLPTLGVIVIFILLGFWFADSEKSVDDYERCIDNCVSNNYGCLSSIKPLYNNVNQAYWNRNDVKSCHNGLENCVSYCQ